MLLLGLGLGLLIQRLLVLRQRLLLLLLLQTGSILGVLHLRWVHRLVFAKEKDEMRRTGIDYFFFHQVLRFRLRERTEVCFGGGISSFDEGTQ